MSLITNENFKWFLVRDNFLSPKECDKLVESFDKEKKNIQQINIELDEKVSSGEYANFVVVTHSPAEFVMDFTRILPGVPKAKVHSRIIMAPQHAKAFLGALNDNIKKFETKHGEIKMPSRDEGFSSFGVKPPKDVLPN